MLLYEPGLSHCTQGNIAFPEILTMHLVFPLKIALFCTLAFVELSPLEQKQSGASLLEMEQCERFPPSSAAGAVWDRWA